MPGSMKFGEGVKINVDWPAFRNNFSKNKIELVLNCRV